MSGFPGDRDTPIEFGPGSRVYIGKSRRVHIVRPGTVYTMRGYGTTFCGYYGNPANGWMRVTNDEPTCRACLRRFGGREHTRREAAPPDPHVGGG